MCNIIGSPDDIVKLAQALVVLVVGIALAIRIAKGRGPLRLRIMRSMLDLTSDEPVKKDRTKK